MINYHYSIPDDEVIDVERSRRRGRRWVTVSALCVAVIVVAVILLLQIVNRADATSGVRCTLGASMSRQEGVSLTPSSG